jgi:hypothetical protein
MIHPRLRASVLFVLVCLALLPPSVSAADKSQYQTGFTRWRAADGALSDWELHGVVLVSGVAQIDLPTANPEKDPYPAGGYNGHNYYNGGSFWVGEMTSPEITTSFNFSEAIASWNADTPTGSWIETQLRVKIGARWTKWYSMGVWAADYTTIERHSVNHQGDADGYVAVDTLVLAKKITTDVFQLKLRLFSTGVAIPSVRNVSLAYSTTAKKSSTLSTGDSSLWHGPLNVPQCSQMVYPDGGEVWCSPTSTSMVLSYWANYSGPCEPRVRAAVAGVYDWLYDGHGNWPFNTAYAATQGQEGYVARFTSLAQLEPWIAAGVPVVMSVAWKKGDLTGSTIPSTNGHLLVLVGFDGSGNPIINDPAAASDAGVRVTYARSEFEPLWLEASGGTVYLIYPPGWPVPSL